MPKTLNVCLQLYFFLGVQDILECSEQYLYDKDVSSHIKKNIYQGMGYFNNAQLNRRNPVVMLKIIAFVIHINYLVVRNPWFKRC